jgi:hypothetical protein
MPATGLQDRMEDLEEGRAGNVHAQVVTAMNAAWEYLHDDRTGECGAESLSRAGEQVQSAIDALTLHHARLSRLDDELAKEAIAELAAK